MILRNPPDDCRSSPELPGRLVTMYLQQISQTECVIVVPRYNETPSRTIRSKWAQVVATTTAVLTHLDERRARPVRQPDRQPAPPMTLPWNATTTAFHLTCHGRRFHCTIPITHCAITPYTDTARTSNSQTKPLIPISQVSSVGRPQTAKISPNDFIP